MGWIVLDHFLTTWHELKSSERRDINEKNALSSCDHKASHSTFPRYYWARERGKREVLPCSCHLPPNIWKLGWAGPAPCQNNTIESTLLAQVCVSHPQSCEYGEHSPLLLSCGGMGREWWPPAHPSMSEACGRAGLVVIWVGNLSLTPTSCNAKECRLCTSPLQHNRANPISSDMGGPVTFETELVARSWELPPLLSAKSSLARMMGVGSTIINKFARIFCWFFLESLGTEKPPPQWLQVFF